MTIKPSTTENEMTTTPLPPLPVPKGKIYFEAEPYQPAWVSSSDAFDDDQMQVYALAARADLEAENARLRGPLEIPPEESDRVMTVVYRNPTRDEVQSFMDHPKAVWFGWCHAPHQRDAARADLEAENKRLREALKTVQAAIYMDDAGQLRFTKSFDESVIDTALERQP